MDSLKPYAKAIVPLAVGVVLFVLQQFGITPDLNTRDALTLIVTSGLVWLVPNRQ